MYALDEVSADGENFRLAVLNQQPYKPLYVKLKLVWRCNLRCGMCNHWREERERPLSLNRLKAVVDDLAELGCRKVHISGGEPMLYLGLTELVAHMSGHGLRVNMTTNGTLLTKERARALAGAGLRSVTISLDSPARRLHDQIRGVRGAWKKSTKGFRYLRRYLKKGKMTINTVIGRKNFESLVDLPDFAAELGADMINLIPLDEHTGDLQRLNRGQILEYNEQIGPVIAEKGLALGLIDHLEQAYPFGQSKAEIRLSKKGLYARGYYDHNPCFAPYTHALINHSGQVNICCMLRDTPVMGDLRQQSFREIWTGLPYTLLRQKGATPLFSTCRSCDHFLEKNGRLAELLEPPVSEPASTRI